MRKFTILFVVSLILVYSCTKDTTSSCGTTTYKYSTDISVIMTSKCNQSGCHNVQQGDVPNLLTYANVKEHSSHILSEINSGRMPKSGSPALTTDEKGKIVSWINACSPNN